jgi:hypothetical protein
VCLGVGVISLEEKTPLSPPSPPVIHTDDFVDHSNPKYSFGVHWYPKRTGGKTTVSRICNPLDKTTTTTTTTEWARSRSNQVKSDKVAEEENEMDGENDKRETPRSQGTKIPAKKTPHGGEIQIVPSLTQRTGMPKKQESGASFSPAFNHSLPEPICARECLARSHAKSSFVSYPSQKPLIVSVFVPRVFSVVLNQYVQIERGYHLVLGRDNYRGKRGTC